ncbi:hypothetical protein BBA70_00270 [New Jersey aster yellows phytoplasma]|uniref:Uncharacterized protein n=1 Tax=New Jersey aster yellows phytoplasma TaxID=270520 RepID=A0ABX4K0X0_9MOLU|nr:hypothetical protein BBA70_00270 [New Jersey aster yellows phytoplasma]
MLNLNDLNMNKEYISLSFHVLIKHLIQLKGALLIKNKLKNLRIIYFFVKTTDFGQGCFSKFFLHLYRLINSIQKSRLKKIIN